MESSELLKVGDTEADLIGAARQGNSEALTELFDRYQPLVRRLWIKMTIPGFDRDDWQQEAFLVLTRAVRTYRTDQATRFCWYFHHLLENRLRDLYRRKVAIKRVPEHLIQAVSVDNDLAILPAATPSPEEVVLRRERRRQFLAACSRMEREVMILASFGHNTEETARLMGCSPAKVKNARHRARAKFRWLFGGRGK